ncbi:MAG: hypothetical protein ABW034_24360 [Steroidobacteraceae bacterium]
MTCDNVIPFRKRPPSDVEMEVYRRATQHWSPQMRELMFPEHFKREQETNTFAAARP